MISFAHPALLWGLTALTLPLAIHLLSRKEGKVILIGSLRHLQESNTRQSLNIRLNELLLLLLRMIAISLLVFYISGLQWQKSSTTQVNWLLIEKGLEQNKKLTAVFDSLQQNGYEGRFLSPGFPLLEDSADVTAIASYWDLVKTMQSREFSRVMAFSFNRMELFRGTRASLPTKIQWIACDVEPNQFPVQGTSIDGMEIIRMGYSSASSTRFETIKIANDGDPYFKLPNDSDSIALTPPDTLRIWLPSEAPFKRDANVLRAALGSLQEAIPQTKMLIDSKPVLKKYDWKFQFVAEGHQGISADHTIIFKPNSSPTLFVQSSVQEWQLTRRLTEGIALKENLSIKLCQILIPAQAARAIASLNDRRSMDGKGAWTTDLSNNSGTIKAILFSDRLDNLVMALLVIIIMIERVISHHRNQ